MEKQRKKRTWGRLIKGTLATVLVAGLIFPTDLNAAVLSAAPGKFVVLGRTAKSGRLPTTLKNLDNGATAYCLNYNKPTPANGTTIPDKGTYTNDLVWKIMKYGYPHQTWYNTGDAEKDKKANFYVTQMAVWAGVEGWSEDYIQNLAKASPTSKWQFLDVDVQGMKDNIKALLRQAKADPQRQQPTIEVSPAHAAVKIVNGKMSAGPLTLRGNNIVGTANIELINPPSGAIVKNTSGTVTNSIAVGGQFYIEMPIQPNVGSLQYKIKANGESMVASTYEGGTRYQDIGAYHAKKVSISAANNGKISWGKMQGDLTINKTGEGKALPGAVFRVWGNGHDKQYTTNASGKIVISGLTPGTYNVQEIQAPAGYDIDSSIKQVTIVTGSGGSITINNNPSEGEIDIVKKDFHNKEPIAGVDFRIWGGDYDQIHTTDDSGRIHVDKLPVGSYNVQEVKPAKGYNKNDKVYTAEIAQSGDVASLEILNHPADGSIDVIKTDAQGDRIEGVTFRLTGPNGFRSEKKTNINGIVRWDKLPFGTYTLIEVNAPEGYIPTNDSWTFTIGPGDDEHRFQQVVVNKKVRNKISLIKLDSVTQEPLSGAVFRVTGPEGYDKEHTTDGAGTIYIANPVQGDWTVQEIKSPEGYILNEEPYYFTVEKGGPETVEIVLENTQIRGNIKLRKLNDANDEPLAGADFRVQGPNGYNEVHTTKQDGWIALENMPYGDYTITEIKAPEGFVLNDKPIKFKIDTPNKTYEFKKRNTKIHANIDLTKVDEETGKPLADAKFRITGPNGYDEIFKTNKDGKILFEYLPYGEYQVQEVLAPPGYVLNDTIHTVNITENSKSYEIRATNRKISGVVEVVKKGTDGKLLEGAVFELQSLDDGNVVFEETTGANGIARFENVKFGDYRLKEKKAPEGYLLTGKQQTVTVDTENKVYQFEYTNKQIVSQIVIRKLDEDTREPLPGAIFRIEKDGKFWKEIETNEVGNARIDEAPYGSYVITEIKAPDGYVLSNKEITLDITEDHEIYEVVVNNQPEKGDIVIEKFDKDGDIPLEGVEFEILNEHRFVVDTLVTDEDGRAVSKKLPLGNYIIKETKPLPGYKPNSKEYPITIGKQEKTVHFTLTNEKATGHFEITKTDVSTGELIPNAKFRIYKEDKKTVVKEGITDENGIARFTLPLGKYYYQEYEAPEGYIIDDSLYPFELKEDGITVKAEMTNKKEAIDIVIDKTGNLISKGLKGAVFQIHKDGKPVEFTKVTPSGTSKVTNLTTDKYGKIRLPEKLGIGTYQIVEVEAPEGFIKAEPLEFVVDKELVADGENLLEFKIKNDEIKGNVKLLKTETDSNKVLEGVTFELIQTKDILGNKVNKKIGEYTTDSNGIIQVNDLLYGEYYFKEIATKEGYVLDSKPIPFKVQENGHTISLTMNNNIIKGGIRLEKVDEETREHLAGVGFELFKLEGDKRVSVGKYSTDDKGVLNIKDLKYGKYVLVETKPANGYVGEGKELEFFIQEDFHTVSLEMSNEKITGKLEISKVDIATGELLPDAGFKIYGEDKKTVIVEGRTDSNGKATFELNAGKYYYQEFDAPEGYVIDESLFPFEIKENGEIIKAEMKNKLIEGEMELTKTDVSTGELLPNAKFEIYAEDKKTVIVKGKTDENGIAKFKLNYGKYYYREFEAPNGYVVDDSLFPFEIKKDGEIVKCEMTNAPESGSVVLKKVDASGGHTLQGAVFELYDNQDNLILEGPTNKDGELIITGLDKGEYYLKEKIPPAGYIKSEDKYKFEIRKDKQIVELCAKNKLEEGLTGNGMPITGANAIKFGIPLVGLALIGGFVLIKRTD